MREGETQEVRFQNTTSNYQAPADITPESTIAECLEDPEFNHDHANKRAIDDARTEIHENEMEQARRHGTDVEYVAKYCYFSFRVSLTFL